MAISPVDVTKSLPNPSAPTVTAGAKPATSAFALLLQNNRNREGEISPEKARALAELMRLEQMRAIIEPFAATTAGSPLPQPATRMIEAFLQQAASTEPEVPPAATPQPAQSPLPVKPSTLPITPVVKVEPAIEPPKSLNAIINQAAERYGVDERLIKAVIKAESNFNPHAVSHAGAQGLMQLMPATARGLGVTNSFDPYQNVMAGTRFLKDMLNRYNGSLDSALAAYNWGPGNVDRKGMAIPRETRDYLAKVKTYYNQLA